MSERPTGTVTLVFTDLQGSTRLLNTLGAQRYAADVLGPHHRVIREALAGHAGVEVDTEGDAFFCVFASAREAIAACARMQRTLAEQAWPDDLPVRVRMGVHTGEPIVASGKYVGMDVHRAARVMSAGSGGQVLVTDATAQLVRDELPAGLTLRDVGEHRLKDLSAPQRLWQLTGEGLLEGFPPIASLESRRTNLPAQPTPLVGRDRELSDLRALLGRGDVRLLTITGSGGIGKTRLALQLAAETIDDHPDGVFVCFLASVTDPVLVLTAVAEAFGLREAPAESIETTLTEFLGPRQLMLVLDNVEHLLTAAPHVARLLAMASRLQIIVTSRAPLRVGGEREYGLEPLTSHAGRVLFVERAAAVRPDFDADRYTDVIDRIVFRLDALPLALELAAARLRVLSPDALLVRLEQSLNLLTGGRRDADERQRTLRATIDWSYRLLDGDEQLVLRRLAVFRGFDLAAAEAVCDPDHALQTVVLDAVESLVAKSLVRVEREVATEPRFFLLETIRAYAGEQLDASRERAISEQRHAALFHQLALDAEKRLTTREAIACRTQLDAEHDNLWLATAPATAPADDTGMELVAALWRYWELRTDIRRAHDFLIDALASRPHAPASTRARCLLAAARLRFRLGKEADAIPLLEESRSLFLESCNRAGAALALAGVAYAVQVDPKKTAYARALAQGAIDEAHTIGDDTIEGEGFNSLGCALISSGDEQAAATAFRRSLELRRRAGHLEGISAALGNLGAIDLWAGDLDAAADTIDEAAVIARENDDAWAIGGTIRLQATVALLRGDLPLARQLFLETADFAHSIGHTRALTLASRGVAATLAPSEPDLARCLYRAAGDFAEFEPPALVALHSQTQDALGVAPSREPDTATLWTLLGNFASTPA